MDDSKPFSDVGGTQVPHNDIDIHGSVLPESYVSTLVPRSNPSPQGWNTEQNVGVIISRMEATAQSSMAARCHVKVTPEQSSPGVELILFLGSRPDGIYEEDPSVFPRLPIIAIHQSHSLFQRH